jgi:hypothetical protein
MTPSIDLSFSGATVGRIPDFLIVGHPKCGTTALFEMLNDHPEVFIPALKEPLFFAEELHEFTPPRPSGTPRTLTEYAEWFTGANAGQKVGDASSLYLWSKVAASNIATVIPEARIVALLREPASFLYSWHLQLLEIYVEVETDLGAATALEPERRAGRAIPQYTYWPQLLLYSEFIRYTEQLRRFHAVFPAEQVKVLIYDDFRLDNEGTVHDVCRFLDVDDSLPVRTTQANPTVAPRSQRMNELVHAVGVGRGPVSHTVKEMIKAVTPSGPRRRALYALKRQLVFGPPAAPPEEVMHELRLAYRDEVFALSEYLDRDLVGLWGYDEL